MNLITQKQTSIKRPIVFYRQDGFWDSDYTVKNRYSGSIAYSRWGDFGN